MFLVIAKTLEVAARALFVLGISYSLELGDAGRFGIIVTLVALFVFAATFERHLDFQRRYIGLSPTAFDHEVGHLLRFWLVNDLAILPALVVAMVVITGVSPWAAACVVVIAVGEHVASGAYQLALVTPRYKRLLYPTVLRNVLAVLATFALWAFGRADFNLVNLLGIWAICQTIGAIGVIAGWASLRQQNPEAISDPRKLSTQHRQSATHFKIGLVAVLAQRADQLIVGMLLPLAQTGIYYRHMLLVTLAYQFFTIVSWSRLMPAVFKAAKTSKDPVLIRLILREWIIVTACLVTGALAAATADALSGHVITTRFHVSPLLSALVFAGALVRITADLAGLILHARMRESLMLGHQTLAFGVTLVAMFFGIWAGGIYGAALATLGGATLYLALIIRSVSALLKASSATDNAALS